MALNSKLDVFLLDHVRWPKVTQDDEIDRGENPPFTRKDIRTETGISDRTLKRLLPEYVKEGVLEAGPRKGGGRGRPINEYRVRRDGRRDGVWTLLDRRDKALRPAAFQRTTRRRLREWEVLDGGPRSIVADMDPEVECAVLVPHARQTERSEVRKRIWNWDDWPADMKGPPPKERRGVDDDAFRIRHRFEEAVGAVRQWAAYLYGYPNVVVLSSGPLYAVRNPEDAETRAERLGGKEYLQDVDAKEAFRASVDRGKVPVPKVSVDTGAGLEELLARHGGGKKKRKPRRTRRSTVRVKPRRNR